jgi:type IV pilus assembly protein PilN
VRIALNLATRPFVDVGPAMKRLRIAMIALAVLSLAALGALHFVHSKAEAARAREHSLDGAIAKINNERQGYEAMMAKPNNARFMTEVDEVNTLFEEKSFSWTMAMESLETELPSYVQVTEIEPQRAKPKDESKESESSGLITIHLRVVGPHDLSDQLVKNLEHSRRFSSPRIVGEEAESANTPNQRTAEPVSISNRFNFDLRAEYVPPTEDELAAEKRKLKAMEAEDRREEAAPAVTPQFAAPAPGAPRPMAPNRVSPLRPPGQPPIRGAYPGVAAPKPMTPNPQGQRPPYTGGPQ